MSMPDIWPDLRAGVMQLYTHLKEGLSNKRHIELYTLVYNYCTRSQRRADTMAVGANFGGAELYEELKNLMISVMTTTYERSLEYRDEVSFLSFVNESWERYTTANTVVNRIFAYLNRHWVTRQMDDGRADVFGVYSLSLVIWRDHFFSRVRQRLTDSLLTLIARERNGEQINCGLVRSVVHSYITLGISDGGRRTTETNHDIYTTHFEGPFLEATEHFYSVEARAFIADHSISEYLKKVESRFREERERVTRYLHEGTSMAPVVGQLQQVLVNAHLEAIRAEFPAFLEGDKEADLRRMYELLPQDAMDVLRSNFEHYVVAQGKAALRDCAEDAVNKPEVFVQTILQVYSRFNGILDRCFKRDSLFSAALDKACRVFVNENEVCVLAKSSNKGPDLLAKYTDSLLKKGGRSTDEAEIGKLLDDVMVIFKYLEDKDVFQKFYSKGLAKRLIHAASASDDLESLMIGKLNTAVGYDYTSKLQRMFNDMPISRDLMDAFRSYCDSSGKGTSFACDFSTMVLATGSWPLSAPTTNFTLPPEVRPCESVFMEFYTQQHTGRKLTWLHQLSKAEVKCLYGGQYTFMTSCYQAGVLALFNNTNSYNNANGSSHGGSSGNSNGGNNLTMAALAAGTNLTGDMLKNTLLTLLKTNVLTCSPKAEKNVEDTVLTDAHSFAVNLKFVAKKKKLNINVVIRAVVKQEDDEMHKAVEEERKLQVQACIVRVMKSRRTLSHPMLMSDVMQMMASRFNPTGSLIKRCIDMLIEKEYMRRDENDSSIYQYIA